MVRIIVIVRNNCDSDFKIVEKIYLKKTDEMKKKCVDASSNY